MSVSSAGSLVWGIKGQDFMVEDPQTVRVLIGCVVNRLPRKVGDVVPDVPSLDARHMRAAGQVEFVNPVSIPDVPPDAAALDQEAEKVDGPNARPARRSKSRAR